MHVPKGVGDHQGVVGKRPATSVRGEDHAPARRDPFETDRLDSPPVAIERTEERRRIAAEACERTHRFVELRAAQAGDSGQRTVHRRAEEREVGGAAIELPRGERLFDLTLERTERVERRRRGARAEPAAASAIELEGLAAIADGARGAVGSRVAVAGSIPLGHDRRS